MAAIPCQPSAVLNSNLISTPPSRPASRKGSPKRVHSHAATGSPRALSPPVQRPRRAAQQALGTPSSSSSRPVARARLPLRLPTYPIAVLSSPYADFTAHLRAHGLAHEAAELGGCTPDYVMAQLPASLHAETLSFETTLRQLAALGGDVPPHVDFPLESSGSISHLFVVRASLGPAPSAVDQSMPPPAMSARGTSTRPHVSPAPAATSRGLLLPVHGLVYALDCATLPPLPPAHDDRGRLPVVTLHVPAPATFGTVHRYVYTRDAAALLAELLPLRFLSRNLAAGAGAAGGAEPAGAALTAPRARELLASLPTATLLAHARTVHAAWGNAGAIGLLDARYWATLSVSGATCAVCESTTDAVSVCSVPGTLSSAPLPFAVRAASTPSWRSAWTRTSCDDVSCSLCHVSCSLIPSNISPRGRPSLRSVTQPCRAESPIRRVTASPRYPTATCTLSRSLLLLSNDDSSIHLIATQRTVPPAHAAAACPHVPLPVQPAAQR
jgi:hypothetical protein